MQVRALEQGLRIREVPVSYRKRAAGVNKVLRQPAGQCTRRVDHPANRRAPSGGNVHVLA